MISKDQANAIAEEILDQQRGPILKDKNVFARRIPVLYRCEELKALEPWQRAQVVREASANVSRQWGVKVCMLFWLLAVMFFWFLFVPVSTRTGSTSVWLLCALASLPQFIVHVSLVRLHVKYIARFRQFSARSSS